MSWALFLLPRTARDGLEKWQDAYASLGNNARSVSSIGQGSIFLALSRTVDIDTRCKAC
jgi:hypothetical protein